MLTPKERELRAHDRNRKDAVRLARLCLNNRTRADLSEAERKEWEEGFAVWVREARRRNREYLKARGRLRAAVVEV